MLGIKCFTYNILISVVLILQKIYAFILSNLFMTDTVLKANCYVMLCCIFLGANKHFRFMFREKVMITIKSPLTFR